jgi:hypothetical protein
MANSAPGDMTMMPAVRQKIATFLFLCAAAMWFPAGALGLGALTVACAALAWCFERPKAPSPSPYDLPGGC